MLGGDYYGPVIWVGVKLGGDKIPSPYNYVVSMSKLTRPTMGRRNSWTECTSTLGREGGRTTSSVKELCDP